MEIGWKYTLSTGGTYSDMYSEKENGFTIIWLYLNYFYIHAVVLFAKLLLMF